MAFNADILLDLITGPAERQVKKLVRSVDRLEQKAGDIDVRFDVDESQIRNADRLLNRLERTRRVKLQVDERIQRDNTPTPGTSLSAGGSGINFAFPVAQVQAATKGLESFSDAYNATRNAVSRNERDINAKLTQRSDLLADITKKRADLNSGIEERDRLQSRLDSVAGSNNPKKSRDLFFGGEISQKGIVELDKFDARVRESGQNSAEVAAQCAAIEDRYRISSKQAQNQAQNRVRNLDKSNAALGKEIWSQTDAYEQVTREVRQLDATERRRALNSQNALDYIDRRRERNARRRQTRNKVGGSVLAGLSTVPIPGQDIFQAAGAGALQCPHLRADSSCLGL